MSSWPPPFTMRRSDGLSIVESRSDSGYGLDDVSLAVSRCAGLTGMTREACLKVQMTGRPLPKPRGIDVDAATEGFKLIKTPEGIRRLQETQKVLRRSNIEGQRRGTLADQDLRRTLPPTPIDNIVSSVQQAIQSVVEAIRNLLGGVQETPNLWGQKPKDYTKYIPLTTEFDVWMQDLIGSKLAPYSTLQRKSIQGLCSRACSKSSDLMRECQKTGDINSAPCKKTKRECVECLGRASVPEVF